MEVHDLGDQSAADDADAQSSLSQAARDYTPPPMGGAKSPDSFSFPLAGEGRGGGSFSLSPSPLTGAESPSHLVGEGRGGGLSLFLPPPLRGRVGVGGNPTLS